MMYAVGQGAIAVECRENDPETLALLKPLYSIETAIAILAERSFLKTLEGGCSAPVAVASTVCDNNNGKKKIILNGAVWSLDGKDEIVDVEQTIIEMKIPEKSKECPYKINKNAECFKTNSSNKRNNVIEDKSAVKKVKAEKSSDVTTEILKKNPHETHPIQMPVGSDFMGKCPYLEETELSNGEFVQMKECPLREKSKSEISDINGISRSSTSSSTSGSTESIKSEKSNLYCGLIQHSDVTNDVFQKAEELGAKLANKLIEKGAKEIMANAQNIIRSTS